MIFILVDCSFSLQIW